MMKSGLLYNGLYDCPCSHGVYVHGLLVCFLIPGKGNNKKKMLLQYHIRIVWHWRLEKWKCHHRNKWHFKIY